MENNNNNNNIIQGIETILYSQLSQREWSFWIRRFLLFLIEKNPPEEWNLYRQERQILPCNFNK